MHAARVAVLGLAAGCTHYDFSVPQPHPERVGVSARIGAASVSFEHVEGATGYRAYAARSASVDLDDPTLVFEDGTSSPIRLPDLAANGQPWHVTLVALFEDDESARSPVIEIETIESGWFEPIAAWTYTSAGPNAKLGSVLEAFDLNGDGIDELALGTPDRDLGADEGYFQLFYGSTGGLDSSPEIDLAGGGSDRFGAALASGDFDGNGLGDLAIGAPGYNGVGRVVLVYGQVPSPVLAQSPGLVLVGSTSFGYALAAVDLNGDGADELAVGDRELASGMGRIHVWAGMQGNPLGTNPAWSIPAPAGTGFGGALANAGDTDGDGFHDLLVGEPDFSTPQPRSGRVHVLFGGTTAAVVQPSRTVVIASPVAQARFGIRLFEGADFDGDGRTELVIADAPATGAPTLHVLHVVDDGFSIGAAFTGGSAGGAPPLSAATADLDLDGLQDLVLGVPDGAGAIQLHTGIPAPEALDPSDALVIPGPPAGALFGDDVALGDFDGDGTPDLAVGRPLASSGNGAIDRFDGSPAVGPRVDAGPTRVDAGTGISPTGGTFTDLSPGPHTCEWTLEAPAPLTRTLPGCTPETAGGAFFFLPERGRYVLRLRVTAADGRFGEAVTTVERPE